MESKFSSFIFLQEDFEAKSTNDSFGEWIFSRWYLLRDLLLSKNRLSKVLVIRSVTTCTHLRECIREKKIKKIVIKTRKRSMLIKTKQNCLNKHSWCWCWWKTGIRGTATRANTKSAMSKTVWFVFWITYEFTSCRQWYRHPQNKTFIFNQHHVTWNGGHQSTESDQKAIQINFLPNEVK